MSARSLYRDLLFLALVALGRNNINISEFQDRFLILALAAIRSIAVTHSHVIMEMLTMSYITAYF